MQHLFYWASKSHLRTNHVDKHSGRHESPYRLGPKNAIKYVPKIIWPKNTEGISFWKLSNSNDWNRQMPTFLDQIQMFSFVSPLRIRFFGHNPIGWIDTQPAYCIHLVALCIVKMRIGFVVKMFFSWTAAAVQRQWTNEIAHFMCKYHACIDWSFSQSRCANGILWWIFVQWHR